MSHLTDFQLNEYLDDAIDETMKHKFDSHLQTCEDCSARLDELKILFTNLESLPEVKLRRDLSPSILARLPQQPRIWTPFFAAQLGAALGILFWLSTQAAKFITSIITSLHFPQFTMPTLQFSMPAFQFHAFQFPNLPFNILHLPFSIFNLPTFQLSNLPAFPLSTLNLSNFNLAFIVISAFLLWLVGNLSLLRNRPGVQK